ncbi:helix-turn-helix domain-containing protein [Kribbella solani]|uniref:Transcriptional regulator with XRE-family HTH domain n=1 Tax=Kribbella solani TaxID=236067 RepID=A0A841E2R6_9ACTN|nr:helix-turn-helix transcriptional regulator [Kribbella solani]MBB5983250.1 transcriptional regulator with XRE-family HTH domain [Kribbella solani]
MSAGDLLRQAREDAGLSRSALAAKAGVPTSTVSRIEAGSSDPTLTMLSRLVAAAGQELSVAVRTPALAPELTIGSLAGAYAPDARVRKINWARLRGFLDVLAEHPELTAAAIASPPDRTGDAAFDALLAGVAEKLADDAGLPRPRWTRSVPSSPTPWETPGTPARIRRARAQTPIQLAARNIWLPTHDLWRNAA